MDNYHITNFSAGAEDERLACAELARAAGCQCMRVLSAEMALRHGLITKDAAKDAPSAVYLRHDEDHDGACPIALAKSIEARGRG